MNRATRMTAFVGGLAFAASMSCSNADKVAGPVDAAPGPVAGRVLVSLQGADAGAVLLILRGTGITMPTAVDSTRELLARSIDPEGTGYSIAVMGEHLSGGLFSFAVSDVTRLDGYTVTLVQVSDESNNLLESLEGYKVTLERQKE